MLKIDHFTKTYGEKKAVDDLSLHIRQGEIYGFIGHNGAGKTTTLKSVAGIMQFDSGEILIDGTSIQRDPIGCKKKMAYIPDNPDLYEFMAEAADSGVGRHLRAHRRPESAHQRLLPRHEAEAGDYLCLDS